MIRFRNTDVYGFEHALRGMRQPYKVTDKSDSEWVDGHFFIGPKDRDLCIRLNRGGSPHNKFLRQIVCWVDIKAPRFWWQEMDTYRAGVEKNSESTMHSIMKQPFVLDDFGFDSLMDSNALHFSMDVLPYLNGLRDKYLKSEDGNEKRAVWRCLINALPQSYMQTRTVMISYQAIRAICAQRKGHRLSEWADFIEWARSLPESWLLFNEAMTQDELESLSRDDWETRAVIDAGR